MTDSPAAIAVTLRAADASATGAVPLVFEVTSRDAHRLCTYNTPFEGFAGDILDVAAADGAEAEYQGISVKRGPPTEANFMDLAPSAPRSVTFDLAEHYALSQGVAYEVRFRGGEYTNKLPDSNALTVTAP